MNWTKKKEFDFRFSGEASVDEVERKLDKWVNVSSWPIENMGWRQVPR